MDCPGRTNGTGSRGPATVCWSQLLLQLILTLLGISFSRVCLQDNVLLSQHVGWIEALGGIVASCIEQAVAVPDCSRLCPGASLT